MAESEKERLDRELIELLNELRVALPGVQVLFAFLLTLPFTNRFERLSSADRAIYFVALVLSVVASGFLIAPSAHHRLRFRDRAKEELIRAGNRMAILGLVCLAAAIAACLSVIADVLYGDVVRIPVTAAALLWLGVLWFAVPRWYARK
jgi:putative flippase GtrA